MISTLLAFRARLDVVITNACDGNDSYQYKLKEVWETFLNARWAVEGFGRWMSGPGLVLVGMEMHWKGSRTEGEGLQTRSRGHGVRGCCRPVTRLLRPLVAPDGRESMGETPGGNLHPPPFVLACSSIELDSSPWNYSFWC